MIGFRGSKQYVGGNNEQVLLRFFPLPHPTLRFLNMKYWEQVLETLSPTDAEQEAWLQSVIDTLENEGLLAVRPRLPRRLVPYFDELSEALQLFEQIHGAKFSMCTTRRERKELSKLKWLRDQCRGSNLSVAY
jgi:hypothetical protein